jgi:hypothetical protein
VEPQWSHTNSLVKGVPQPAQKRASAGLSRPQAAHFIVSLTSQTAGQIQESTLIISEAL